MNHPFALDISDLEDLSQKLEQQLTYEEASQIEGGTTLTTMAVGEEGGSATTLAIGEEGGDGGIVCISAPCPGSETGGDPKPPKPPVTKAWLELGGGLYTKARLETGGRIWW